VPLAGKKSCPAGALAKHLKIDHDERELIIECLRVRHIIKACDESYVSSNIDNLIRILQINTAIAFDLITSLE
jgi:hypothetical protein